MAEPRARVPFQPATAREAYAEMTVLVVDDMPHMVMLLSSMLRELGFRTIVSAGTVAAARKLLQQWNPGLVFVDWVMEPVSGIELVKLIRCGIDIPDPAVPIIMMTGHCDASRVQDARESGVNAFIAKPFSKQLVARRLDAILRPVPKAAAAAAVEDDSDVFVLD